MASSTLNFALFCTCSLAYTTSEQINQRLLAVVFVYFLFIFHLGVVAVGLLCWIIREQLLLCGFADSKNTKVQTKRMMSCIANTYLLTYGRVHINTFAKRTSSHTPSTFACILVYMFVADKFSTFLLILAVGFLVLFNDFFLLILNSCLHIWAQTLLERIAQCLQIHFHIYIHACNSHLRKCFFYVKSFFT